MQEVRQVTANVVELSHKAIYNRAYTSRINDLVLKTTNRRTLRDDGGSEERNVRSKPDSWINGWVDKGGGERVLGSSVLVCQDISLIEDSV